jgi:hypothetical protein
MEVLYLHGGMYSWVIGLGLNGVICTVICFCEREYTQVMYMLGY